MTSADPQNTPFIKALASSDKPTRDAALESLRTYLSGRSQISDLELLKLWKGLYYCMWMQDKPINQQALARDLAALVDVLHEAVVWPFIDAFWKTMSREWSGIGALRMDKYLHLTRLYLLSSLRILSRHKFSPTQLTAYIETMQRTPLNVEDNKIPNGLRYHVLDIYVDEMEKVGAAEMDDGVRETLLAPVERLGKESRTKAVRKSVKECLKDERVRGWRGEAVGEDGGEEEGEGDEWGGIED